jgi:DNA-binding transcriptional regulator YdaS (Cro superfamily)
MDALTFYKSRNEAEVAAVCEKASTNLAYFRQIAYGHRRASPKLAQRLVKASNGELTLQALRPDIYATEGGQAS